MRRSYNNSDVNRKPWSSYVSGHKSENIEVFFVPNNSRNNGGLP